MPQIAEPSVKIRQESPPSAVEPLSAVEPSATHSEDNTSQITESSATSAGEDLPPAIKPSAIDTQENQLRILKKIGENSPPLRGFAKKYYNFLKYGGHLADDPPLQVYPRAFCKEFFFFYGTLKDPAMLAKVLKLRDLPTLQPAKIIGYRYDLWGPYPALLDGPCGAEVYGMAYEVQSADEVRLLEAYETRRYRKVACRIRFEDDNVVSGRTFKWVSNRDELKEGVFDLTEFLRSTTTV